MVKDKRIQTRPINFLFKVFNVDRTKNREVTKVVPLEIKINRYKEQLKNCSNRLKQHRHVPYIFLYNHQELLFTNYHETNNAALSFMTEFIALNLVEA